LKNPQILANAFFATALGFGLSNPTDEYEFGRE